MKLVEKRSIFFVSLASKYHAMHSDFDHIEAFPKFLEKVVKLLVDI